MKQYAVQSKCQEALNLDLGEKRSGQGRVPSGNDIWASGKDIKRNLSKWRQHEQSQEWEMVCEGRSRWIWNTARIWHLVKPQRQPPGLIHSLSPDVPIISCTSCLSCQSLLLVGSLNCDCPFMVYLPSLPMSTSRTRTLPFYPGSRQYGGELVSESLKNS